MSFSTETLIENKITFISQVLMLFTTTELLKTNYFIFINNYHCHTKYFCQFVLRQNESQLVGFKDKFNIISFSLVLFTFMWPTKYTHSSCFFFHLSRLQTTWFRLSWAFLCVPLPQYAFILFIHGTCFSSLLIRQSAELGVTCATSSRKTVDIIGFLNMSLLHLVDSRLS